ncbi:MAG: YesL family protein [Oribacterium sp.]|nr:YesL family protein [Oribacterium sp.]
MHGFFNYDNPVWKFIGRFTDMVVLNLLFIVTSIPIFTIGASMTALYYCTLKIVEDRDDGDFKMFFHSFKQNFKQATLMWLIMLVLIVVFGFDFYFFTKVMTGQNTLRVILRAITMAFILIWLFIFLYVWPVLSRFDNTMKATFANASFMAFRYLGSTLAMLVTDVLWLGLICLCLTNIPGLAMLLLLMGFPVIAWINSTMFSHIFKNYMPAEEPSHDETGEILTDINVDGSVREGADELKHDLDDQQNRTGC